MALSPPRSLSRIRSRAGAPTTSRLGVDWRDLDWVMLGAMGGIIALGLVMVYSTTRNLVDNPYYFVTRQAVALGLGIVVFCVILRIDYRKFRDFSLLAYIAVIVLLLGVITPMGSSAKGAQAWYAFPGGFQFQPAEIAKFLLIVALCGYVNEHRGDMDPWRVTVIVGLAVLPIGLIQLQPDLGTNMVLAAILLGLLAVAGAKGRYLLVLLLLAVTGVYAVLTLGLLQQYQIDRLTSVINPDAASQAAAYNQTQSKNTIGSGGVTGAGLFQGPQTRLGYVPEQHTDFIFTAVAEELGFVGAAVLLVLFAVVMWRTWRTARLARDYYGTLVCSAVFAMLAFQIFENIGMTMAIMPVTGIPLPMMSYGGSSMIATLACLGLVTSVHVRRFS
ncbi:MAG: rod shape-determining protein RodA [Actinobacteria bacterium]|nr:rod shape-determining protein RodA [Actinomycetota bacterium]